MRACRSIDHLFLGTNADNSADMRTKGRQPHISLPGEANGRAKLTAAEVLVIRAIPLDVPQRVVAARYDVSRSVVGQIRNRKSWKHIS